MTSMDFGVVLLMSSICLIKRSLSFSNSALFNFLQTRLLRSLFARWRAVLFLCSIFSRPRASAASRSFLSRLPILPRNETISCSMASVSGLPGFEASVWFTMNKPSEEEPLLPPLSTHSIFHFFIPGERPGNENESAPEGFWLFDAWINQPLSASIYNEQLTVEASSTLYRTCAVPGWNVEPFGGEIIVMTGLLVSTMFFSRITSLAVLWIQSELLENGRNPSFEMERAWVPELILNFAIPSV